MPQLLSEPQTFSIPEAPPQPQAAALPDRLFRRLLPIAAPGVEPREVRWLTTWCPDGRMAAELLSDLGRLLDLPDEALAGIRGMDWSGSRCKLDGVAWVEHVVAGRPFLWLEDDYGFGERERRFLEAHGMADRYRQVNVTEDAAGLARVHRELRRAEEAE